MMTMFRDVEGFFNDCDRMDIQRAVIETSYIPGDVLEVGVYNGLSAMFTLTAMECTKKLFLVDKFDWTNMKLTFQKYNVPPEMFSIHIQDFTEFHAAHKDSIWSHVHIDHDHSYETNVGCIELFWPQLSIGGIMSFHDYGEPGFPGVKKAVDELLQRQGTVPFHVGYSVSVRKTS
jgi:predicted O-methyltransferase YrrM